MAYTVNDFLVEHAPVVGNDINQKMLEQPTPWINLYSQEFWEDQTSSVQKTYTFDRAIVVDSSGDEADPVDWENTTTAATDTNSDGAYRQTGTGDGIPPADYLEYTQTIRDCNLQHKAIWGPPMNTNKLRDKFERAKQVDATVKAMADQEREFWVDRKRDEYTRICDNLVVLDSGFSLDGGDYNSLAFPAATGTDSSILTNGFLDEIYEYMNLHGAAKGCMGFADNRPVYGLVTSARQGRRLIHADPDIREDFRYSSQNEKLLAPMGVKYTYNGWTYLSDDMIKRWEWYATGQTATIAITETTGAYTLSAALGNESTNGAQLTKGSVIYRAGVAYIVKSTSSTTAGVVVRADGAAVGSGLTASNAFTAWLRVPQFVMATVGGVRRRIPNPKWLIATWEDSYVFHQATCTSLVPRPISAVGKANFAPLNYAGEIKWTNYEDKTDNPDKTIGQFRAVMANGTRPDNPEFGIAIRHLAVPRPDGRIMGEDSLG